MAQIFRLNLHQRDGNYYAIPFQMNFDTTYMDTITKGWLIPHSNLNKVHIPNDGDSFVQSDLPPTDDSIRGVLFRYTLNNDNTTYFAKVDVTLFDDALTSNSFNQWVDFTT